MTSHRFSVFIYTALPSEARPLVDHFGLKKMTELRPFDIYGRQDMCLTVTGLGKCAMAAGVAYSQALMPAVEHPVLLNIGIAGHEDHALGRMFLIDRIIDCENGKTHYPPLLFAPVCPTGAVQTASRPQLGYDRPWLFDMEASAFYETAVRFTTAELAQCLKVVSDNRSSPADTIKPRQVSAWIADEMPAIEATLAELIRLAESITFPEPAVLSGLTRRHHFTASERAQLKKLLSIWDCLTDHRALDMDAIGFCNAGEILRWLEQEIGRIQFKL
ncbi:MAG: hypothetical protein ACU841_05500 [Gammaproteobacteria bacterium]